jgi:hypothetical protein
VEGLFVRSSDACLVSCLCLSMTLQVLPQISSTPVLVKALRQGTLLRVQLDRTAKLKVGTPVSGHLIDPVFLFDREVLPSGALITGYVVGASYVPAKGRIWQLLNGDITPTRTPHIVFESVALPGGPTLEMRAQASERIGTLVHMQNAAKHGKLALFHLAKTQARERLQRAHDTYIAPGKKDRLEKFFFNQLPYHPQRIWRATQFDVELSQPLDLHELRAEDSARSCAQVPEDQMPASTLHARLLTDISSKTAKAGDSVDAVLAQPVFADDTGMDAQLLLPEGAHLRGTVLKARPARWFSRPGVLRFALKQVSVTSEETCSIQQKTRDLALFGQLSAIQSSPGENITINSEGEAQAGPSPNRLLAPLTLAVLVVRTQGDDGSSAGTGATSGGGFGLAGRLVSLASRNANVTAGFAYYALGKSVIRRFILRGHEVEFPRNTRFDIDVSPRTGNEKPLR